MEYIWLLVFVFLCLFCGFDTDRAQSQAMHGANDITVQRKEELRRMAIFTWILVAVFLWLLGPLFQ